MIVDFILMHEELSINCETTMMPWEKKAGKKEIILNDKC